MDVKFESIKIERTCTRAYYKHRVAVSYKEPIF